MGGSTLFICHFSAFQLWLLWPLRFIQEPVRASQPVSSLHFRKSRPSVSKVCQVHICLNVHFQVIPISLVASAISLTLLVTNTFHAFARLVSQCSATIVSIQVVVELMGQRCRAPCRAPCRPGFAMFAVIWPLTSSSLAT